MTLRNAVRTLRPWSTLERVFHQSTQCLCTAEQPKRARRRSRGKYDKLPVPASVEKARLAGRLAHMVRRNQEEERPIVMLATGINASNVAVKTMHAARRYLSEKPGIGLCFRVNHEKGADKDRVSKMKFAVYPTKEYVFDKNWSPTESMEEMWVERSLKGRALGKRIVGALENAKSATVTAIGPRSVGNVSLGLTWARRVLQGKNLDIVAVPHMKSVSVKNKDKEMTAVQFILTRVPYQELTYLDPAESFDDTKREILHDVSVDPKAEDEDDEERSSDKRVAEASNSEEEFSDEAPLNFKQAAADDEEELSDKTPRNSMERFDDDDDDDEVSDEAAWDPKEASDYDDDDEEYSNDAPRRSRERFDDDDDEEEFSDETPMDPMDRFDDDDDEVSSDEMPPRRRSSGKRLYDK